MHETSFIQAILKNIENPENVLKLFIEVGELAGIDAGHLKEHLEEVIDREIEISEKSSKVKCKCGYQGKAKIRERLHDLVIFECPECGNIPEILEGKDIKILKIIYK